MEYFKPLLWQYLHLLQKQVNEKDLTKKMY